MTAKNPQLADKIIVREQLGSGIFFSDDTATPVLGVVTSPAGQEGIQLEVDNVSTGSVSTQNLPIFSGQQDLRADAGAVDPSSSVTEITTTGAAAITLADGNGGETIYLYMSTDGGDATLTPTNLLGYTTITFNDVGDAVVLYFDGTNWVILSAQGVALA